MYRSTIIDLVRDGDEFSASRPGHFTQRKQAAWATACKIQGYIYTYTLSNLHTSDTEDGGDKYLRNVGNIAHEDTIQPKNRINITSLFYHH